MALTRAEIAYRLQQRRGLDVITARQFTESFFECLVSTLEQGIPVKLTGFGNFELRNKVARPGRNPKTGEDVEISARRVVTFKGSPKMLQRVQKP